MLPFRKVLLALFTYGSLVLFILYMLHTLHILIITYVQHSECCVFYRDNILVLDVFFEALNYETIEQRKAYEVAGLLGKSSSHWLGKVMVALYLLYRFL